MLPKTQRSSREAEHVDLLHRDDDLYEGRLRAWKDACARLGGDSAPAGDHAEDAREEDTGDEAGPSQPQQHTDAGYVPFTQAEQSQLDGTHRKPLYENLRLQPEAVEHLRAAVRRGEGTQDPVVPDSDGLGHGSRNDQEMPDSAQVDTAAETANPAGSQPEQTRRSRRLASAGQKAADAEQAEQPRSNRGSGRWFPTAFTNALNSITSSFRSTPPAAAAAEPQQQDEVVSQLTSETEGTSSDAVPGASPKRRQPPRAAKAVASQRLAAGASDRHESTAEAQQSPPHSQQGAASSQGRAGGGRGRPLAPRRRAAPVVSAEAAVGELVDEGTRSVRCTHVLASWSSALHRMTPSAVVET